MKPDTEPEFRHSNGIYAHDPKPFECDNNTFDSADEDTIMNKNQIGLFRDLKDYEKNSDTMAPETKKDKDEFQKISDLECDEGRDALSKADENETKDSAAPYNTSSRKITQSENEYDFYTDKNVMECEVPKSLVCLKESTYHVVKDICIDEGVVVSENVILPKNAMDEQNGNGVFKPSSGDNKVDIDENVKLNGIQQVEQKGYIFNACNGDKISEVNKETVDVELLIADVSKLSSNKDCCREVHVENGLNGKVGDGLLIPEDFKSSPRNDFSREGATDSIVEAKSNATDNKVEYVSLKSHLQSAGFAIEDRKSSTQAQYLGVTSENVAFLSKPGESTKCASANDIFYNSKVESGTITFDFNSVTPVAVSSEDGGGRDGVDHKQPLLSHNVVNHGDRASDNLSPSNPFHLFHGESSFSAACPHSGLINYSGSIPYSGSIEDTGSIPYSGSIMEDSGQVPYSGSISLRSDGSVTSGRSFAFPVLQPEWNSSPVRMAKADRRHYRKHRGWRHGLLCCRF